jgi:hypothetical protein
VLLGLAASAASAASASAACVTDSGSVCLLSRYEVRAEWWQGNAAHRPAIAVSLPDGQVGGLVFHSARSWDAAVRVDNRCDGGGAVAVAVVATSWAQALVRVRDVETGIEKIYRKRRGALPGTIVDAAAFACPTAVP